MCNFRRRSVDRKAWLEFKSESCQIILVFMVSKDYELGPVANQVVSNLGSLGDNQLICPPFRGADPVGQLQPRWATYQLDRPPPPFRRSKLLPCQNDMEGQKGGSSGVDDFFLGGGHVDLWTILITGLQMGQMAKLFIRFQPGGCPIGRARVQRLQSFRHAEKTTQQEVLVWGHLSRKHLAT